MRHFEKVVQRLRQVLGGGAVLALCFIMSACASPVQKTGGEGTPYTLSAWVVDWQGEAGISETRQANGSIDQISLFAAYFDGSGDVYLTEESAELIDAAFEEAATSESTMLLTIVNDQYLNDGRVVQKNPVILREILETRESRSMHVKQIMGHVSAYPFSGVELDYEKIPKELIGPYLEFLEELRNALSEKGFSLRVVLEPGFPSGTENLPKGIEYTVMAYNLHGPHSEPGPKADFAFIRRLTENFPKGSRDVGMALAAGGFSWGNGDVKALTERQAIELAENSGSPVIRDDRSGALYFKYEDGGQETEVWYADAKTLKQWMDEFYKGGGYTDFSIWRMGGLSDETLALLSRE